MRRSLIIIALLILFPSSAFAIQWIFSGGESCLVACKNANLNPVISGTYSRNGNPFFICRANAGNEGNRAGFNLQPNWSNHCFVAWGDDGKGYQTYDCACE